MDGRARSQVWANLSSSNIGTITSPDGTGVVIRVGADNFDLTGLSGRQLPLDEFRP